MLSERDRRHLLRLKAQIIGKCTKCRGKNISCSCSDIFRLEFKKVKANIPIKYRTASFEQITHPETSEVRLKLKNYIDKIESHFEEGDGLFLYGSTGLGKTSLVCATLIEALKKQMTGYFITLDRCVSMLASGWRSEEMKEQFQSVILDTDFLVLDEVGNETRTNVTLVKTCLNDVLRQRSNNLLPTIITSNLYFNRIQEIYGDEVYSIINESCIPLEFKGVDFRQNVIGDTHK